MEENLKNHAKFLKANVVYCAKENATTSNGNIFRLKISVLIPFQGENQKKSNENFNPSNFCEFPKPGQFFMLRKENSRHTLARPISVFSARQNSQTKFLEIEFLILKKGSGTSELCELKIGEKIEALGPLGNGFSMPQESEKICIVGGGIGVAPVSFFASCLKEKSFDFFACFKSGIYGIENFLPKSLNIATEDGSQGTRGTLAQILDAQKLKKNGYTSLYACGPFGMLFYLQKICAKAGVKTFFSMEKRMACGVGACLGCTIKTTHGNKRCCKDGPVFDGEILIFDSEKSEKKSQSGKKLESCNKKSNEFKENEESCEKKLKFAKNEKSCDQKSEKIKIEQKNQDEISLKTKICGIEFESPVIAASGTFGFAQEYKSIFDVNELGGICSKGLTLKPKNGNEGERIFETTGGIINSIGLENPGVEFFVKNELPKMLHLKPVTIANLSGSSIEDYEKAAEILNFSEVPLIEVNISCPNVKAGGIAFGLEIESAKKVVSAVRRATKKPLIVKLSPAAKNINEIAFAVKDAGANAVSLVNTFPAVAIDTEKMRPFFKNVSAGLSGEAIKPLALKIVYDLCFALKNLPPKEQFPVVAIGGISCAKDALEFILAGASAVQVGTAFFSNPFVAHEIIFGIKDFMKKNKFKTLEDFRGAAL